MNEEFLQGLGLEQDITDKILAEYNAEKLDNALKSEFKKAGVCDRSAADALLDRSDISLDNVAEKVALLKAEHPALFKTNAPKIISTAQPVGNIEKGVFEKMGYKERLELFKKSPDIYKKLVK